MRKFGSSIGLAVAALLLVGCEADGPASTGAPEAIALAEQKTRVQLPGSGHEHVEPPPAGWMLSPTATGMAPIASGIDPELSLQRSWDTGGIPVSAAPDVVGAFRMTCAAGDLAYIDPVVYPGTVGKSHLHQFYGLRDVRPDETYQSSLAPGRQSTCGTEQYSLNRSNYWLPALLLGNQVIQPNFVSVYYKRRPKSDPLCNWSTNPRGEAAECVDIPQGLRMIAGFDMLLHASAVRPKPTGYFTCSNGAKSVNLEDLLPDCTGAAKLSVILDFPNCWDGKHLDSPDHRSHLAYGSYGDWGYYKCPVTHPKLIPGLHIAAEYSLSATDDRALIRLSSDEAFPALKRGTSLHGDATIAWDPVAYRAFHDNCIDKLLNCSGGDLGNGTQLKGAAQPTYGWTNPNRLVPMPARPS